MRITLAQFVEKVPGFRTMNEPSKIKLFAWFVHRAQQHDRVNTSDIRECYDAAHMDRPNISENLSRLNERSPRVLLKDGRGFYLEGKVRAELDGQYLALVHEQPVEVDGHLVPDQMIEGTRPHLEKLAWQINGCYQYNFYDGCAVLMRRMIESLLIEVFIKAGHVEKIRQNNEFMMLAGIIVVAKQGKCILLARGSDEILEAIKYLGDRAAHSRTYVSVQKDVLDLIPRFRTVIAELLHLARITPVPAKKPVIATAP